MTENKRLDNSGDSVILNVPKAKVAKKGKAKKRGVAKRKIVSPSNKSETPKSEIQTQEKRIRPVRPKRDTDIPADLKQRGYKPRWCSPTKRGETISDVIASYQAMGYELVKRERKEVTKSVGGGQVAVLMQIPDDWYNEYQKEEQAEVDRKEKGIYRIHETAEGREAGATATPDSGKVTSVERDLSAPPTIFGKK